MFYDKKYMYRCLQLARLGMEHVAPNPMVGAVLVHNDTIIGEGYHKRYGDWHAEPNAINSVKDESLLAQSTLYVSLEPCSHYGKTPPCAKLIIEKHIPRVVVGILDPNPLVAGRGIKMMQDAGIEVETGVLEQECYELNKRFFCYQEKKRPYITLKWAQTQDGFIDRLRASKDEPVLVISNPLTKQQVHRMRAENMAIMVGTRTALLDNPGLRTTRWSGRNPLRVVIDKKLQLTADYKLMNSEAATLVFSEKEAYNFKTEAEVVPINFEHNAWQQMLDELYKRGINSLLVEGGAILLNSLINENLWDEAHIEVSPITIKNGVQAPKINAFPYKTEKIEDNTIMYFRNKTITR